MPLPKLKLIKMVTTIEIKGIKNTVKFLVELPKQERKELFRASTQWLRGVQKSARLRAPRRTGALRESIKIAMLKRMQVSLIVESPYGIYQEFGFTPHWVHALMPAGVTGETIGDVFNIAGYARVARHKPFLQPALDANKPKFPSILNKAAKTAIQKSRR